jgi:Xaa-Pro dipeptidase
MTEADVLAATFSGMFAAGGHVPAIAPPLASGPRTLSRTHGAATQRVMQEDDLLVLEVGGCLHRYHAVGVQSKWIGDAPRAVRDRFDGLLEALDAGYAATAPGVPTADVARAVNQVLGRHGAFTEGNHVGYGTGIGYPPTWLDNLRIKETDAHVLERNTVFFMFVHETVQHESTPIELFIGEPILVTDGGAERLSAVPLSLDVA